MSYSSKAIKKCDVEIRYEKDKLQLRIYINVMKNITICPT